MQWVCVVDWNYVCWDVLCWYIGNEANLRTESEIRERTANLVFLYSDKMKHVECCLVVQVTIKLPLR